MNINKEDFKKFSEQGFLVIKSKEIAQLKDNLTTYLSEIILHIVKISKIKIDLKSLIGKTDWKTPFIPSLSKGSG